MFDGLVAMGGPLGLYAEEWDPLTGEQLGNFPQALTHATSVQAALALGDAKAACTTPLVNAGGSAYRMRAPRCRCRSLRWPRRRPAP